MAQAPYKSTPGDQLIDPDGAHTFTATSPSATAGTVQAVPATVRGYLNISVNGVPKKIPYFDV